MDGSFRPRINIQLSPELSCNLTKYDQDINTILVLILD
ncbi:hypothetical protein DSUL_30109 [Desulfovibrionales bacterium]